MSLDPNEIQQRLEALEAKVIVNASADAELKDLIDDLKRDRDTKKKELNFIARLAIVGVIGLFSLSTRYEVQYSQDTGAVLQSNPNAGFWLPGLYSVAAIAVMTGNEKSIEKLLLRFGQSND